MWRDGAARAGGAPASTRSRPTSPATATPPARPAGHVGAPRRGARALPRRARARRRCALVVHDWGGLIGLRWACDHPDAVARARHLRHAASSPTASGAGPARSCAPRARASSSSSGVDREGFGGAAGARLDRASTPDAVDEYFKAFGDEDRRRGQLELYRSGDFEKLEPYEGKLAAARRADAAAVGRRDDFAAGRPARTASRTRSPARRSWCSRAPGTSWSTTRRTATPRSSCASSRRRARARHAELVVALVALVDRAGGVDVDGQHLPAPGTAGPGPRRARARPGSSPGTCAGVSVVPSTDTTTSKAPAARAAAVDDRHQVAGVRAVGAGLGLDAERAQVGAVGRSGGRPPRSTSPTRRGAPSASSQRKRTTVR